MALNTLISLPKLILGSCAAQIPRCETRLRFTAFALGFPLHPRLWGYDVGSGAEGGVTAERFFWVDGLDEASGFEIGVLRLTRLW